MSTTILLPVKRLADAKQRLSNFLSAEEREYLARAMFLDVCATLAASNVSGVTVYSADMEVLRLARSFHFEDCEELRPTTHSDAVNQMLPSMIQSSGRILCVAADLPELRSEEVNLLLSKPGESLVILVSEDGTGTNALLFRSDKPIRASFGPGSCARHLALAKQAGLQAESAHTDGFARDIDTLEDLRGFLRRPQLEGRTSSYLRESGIAERVSNHEA